MGNAKWYAVSFAAGAAIAVAIMVFVVLPRIRGPLDAELARVRESLVNAQELNRQLTASNQRLAKELATASDTVAEQKRLIREQQSELASQQSEIARQRGLLDRQKQGLGALADAIQSGGNNLVSRARAIAEGFDKLYAVYNQGAGKGEGP